MRSKSEARGNAAEANSALAHALRLVPNDPGLLQWEAELALGARERALELLQAAASDQSPYLHYALADPRLIELRGDPAFERLRVSRL